MCQVLYFSVLKNIMVNGKQNILFVSVIDKKGGTNKQNFGFLNEVCIEWKLTID